MDIIRDRATRKLFLSQKNYILKVVKRFNMGQQFKLSSEHWSKSQSESREMYRVGSIMYAMICSRPDLAHAVSMASKFMGDPCRFHLDALKWFLRYLNGTSNYNKKLVGNLGLLF